MADETKHIAHEAAGSAAATPVATPVAIPVLQPATQPPTDEPVALQSEGHHKNLDGQNASPSAEPSTEQPILPNLPADQSVLSPPPGEQTSPHVQSHHTVSTTLDKASNCALEASVIPSHEHGRQPGESLENTQPTDLAPAALSLSRPCSVAPPERAYINVQSQDLASGSIDLSKNSKTTVTRAGITRQSDSTSNSPLSRPQDLDPFPNQAYNALQTHHNPRPHSSHSIHMWASNSSSQLQSPDHPEGGFKNNDDFHFPSDATSRPNSATSSPGLFATASSPLRPNFAPSDSQASYPSPYLHHTHRQVPKETHLAEIGVDSMSGHKLVNHYEIIDELGRGVHGKVKLGRNLENGQYVAIKIVERESKRRRLGRTDNQETKIKREIAILKKARHPNIVGLLEVIDDPAKKKVYIVLEHVELGEVRWRVKGEDEITLLEWRRCQREANGVFKNDAADQEDQNILDTAHRHLERQERRLWEEAHRRRVERGESPHTHWSLEHGGDSDYEEPSWPTGLSQRKSRSRYTSPAGDQNIDASQPADGSDPKLWEPQEPDTAPEQSTTEAESQPKKKRWSDHLSPSEYHTALDGTIQAPRDISPPRQETPNAMDSFASSALDDDEIGRIPEHYRYIPLMTLGEARRAIRDTVLGLEYLHYQGVIHRDIKPANLLQTKDHRIKISDFGVSYLGKAVDDRLPEDVSDAHDHDEAVELAKTVGTPAFYAPELCQLDCIDTDLPPVTGQIDVWALGVTLYCLVFGRVPFHDINAFALMRLIAEQDVYIPDRRLKAVDEHPLLRASSRSRGSQSMDSNKRLSHDLEYEEVSDELRDLLKRLLTKDPRKRIKLTEVKHHPWLLSGIQDPIRWIDESDPSHMTKGKRIEVSKEDVDVAVVPLTIVDRIVDRTASVVRKIGGAFGIGRSGSRRRAKSSATAADNPISSNASSSSTISQDARRHEARRGSVKPEDLARARDGEHPLSQSVTASPVMKERTNFFPSSQSRPESPMDTPEILPQRPSGFERAPTTGSIRTIRPSDVAILTASGATTLPALSSTPQTLEMPPAGLGGIFGGTRKTILKKVGSREHQRSRTPSVDGIALGDDNAHGEPSLALSHAIAAGMVNTPGAWQDGNLTSSSVAASPISSRAPSVAGLSDAFRSKEKGVLEPLSRQSSLSSVASRGMPFIAEGVVLPTRSIYLPLLGEAVDEYSMSRQTVGTSDERIAHAKEEQIRRLIQEGENQTHKRPMSASGNRPQSSLSQRACPPSPDDIMFGRVEEAGVQHQQFGPLSPSATSYAAAGPRKSIVNSSSEDHFTSGMSQSTSNPSIPSVISVDSSVTTDNDGFHVTDIPKDHSILASDETIGLTQQLPAPHDDYEGYAGDHTIDSGDESDGSYIEMSMKKPVHRTAAQRTASSSSIGQLDIHRRPRRSTEASVKSVRSGSDNTMQKVLLSHSDGEEEPARS